MTQTGAIGAHNAKVMNRFDLTKRLVAQLKHEEAVIGGIGNANFDLWEGRPAPAEFLHAGQHGAGDPDRARHRPSRSRSATWWRWKATARC